MLKIIIAIAVSYIIGSLPTAYILGKVLKGIDIRKHGSGNVGATNALRVLGTGPGLVVLLIDLFKGFVPTVFIADYLIAGKSILAPDTLRLLLGASSICGHNWTIFLDFNGGKGVATTLGMLLGLSLRVKGIGLIFCLVLAIWLMIFLISRMVSAASIISGLSLPVFMLIFKQQSVLVVFSLLLAVFLILRHKSNLKRILSGTEPRLSFKKSTH